MNYRIRDYTNSNREIYMGFPSTLTTARLDCEECEKVFGVLCKLWLSDLKHFCCTHLGHLFLNQLGTH